MAIMSTLGGWVAVIAVGGGFYYYHRRPVQRPTAKPQTAAPAEKQKEAKAKKPSGKSNEKAQKKTPQAQKSDEREVTPSTVISNEREDEVDNKEFARQLANIKAGHNPTANKSQKTTKQRSVKQSKAQEKAAVELSSDNATAPSSANGGDADDDQSSVNSPELNATKVAAPVANSGVSDMLEEPAAGPSVLKITEPVNPTQPKKAKAPATFEAVETKKQRQNRKKAEAAKEARQEEEKERKVLMEKQRRTAREAEGRAAKDGSAFMASKTPAESAWVAPTTSTPVNGSNGVNGAKSAGDPVKLLDTYEPAEKKVQAKPADSVYSDSQLKGSDWQKQYSSLPSEEEQERIAIEESDEWQTVKSKTKEKRKPEEKVAKENIAPKEEKPNPVKEQSDFANPPVIAPTGAGQKWETSTAHKAADGSVVQRQQEYQDDEWEVA